MGQVQRWEAIRAGDTLPVIERTTGFGHWNRYAAVNDEFIDDGECVAIALELLEVYRARGYEPQDFFHPYSRFREFERWSFEEAVAGMQEQGRRMLDQGVVGRPSLHVDLMRGRPTEVEQCLVPFLAEADRHGIAVPTARAAYRIIRSLEQMSRSPDDS